MLQGIMARGVFRSNPLVRQPPLPFFIDSYEAFSA
jgi:hypothetical protein